MWCATSSAVDGDAEEDADGGSEPAPRSSNHEEEGRAGPVLLALPYVRLAALAGGLVSTLSSSCLRSRSRWRSCLLVPNIFKLRRGLRLMPESFPELLCLLVPMRDGGSGGISCGGGNGGERSGDKGGERNDGKGGDRV
jgi:uncharacterized membrane protein YgcG